MNDEKNVVYLHGTYGEIMKEYKPSRDSESSDDAYIDGWEDGPAILNVDRLGKMKLG